MQELDDGKVIEMRPYIPTNTLTDQRLYSKVNNGWVTIWTEPKKGGKSSRAKIRRFVKLDAEFWIGLGLFLDERTRLGKRKRDMGRVAITNSNPRMIDMALCMFEKFGIKRSSWKGIISTNSFYLRPSKDFSEKARKYWADEVGISIERISVTHYNRKPKRKRETIPFGTLQIRLESVVINSVIQSFMSGILGMRAI